MDFQMIFATILLPILAVIIPLVARYLKRYVDSQDDMFRVQKIDTIAEAILDMVRLNNPKMDIWENVDTLKDLLVTEILKDSTVPLANPAIANRVAASAIIKAQMGAN